MDSLVQDLRIAVRSLRRAPAFSIAATLALALGTGAAIAVFSLLYGMVLRPLPYPEAERLTMIWDTNASQGLAHEPVSPVNVLDYRSKANRGLHPAKNPVCKCTPSRKAICRRLACRSCGAARSLLATTSIGRA